MTIPEAIEILKAAEAGNVIEYKTTKDGPEHWVRIFEPRLEVIARLLATGYELRVKPEPREWWLSIDVNGNPGAAWATLELAVMWTSGGRKPIHVREVIDP